MMQTDKRFDHGIQLFIALSFLNVNNSFYSALYYLFAETWFAILFTVIVELVPAKTRGVSAGFFIFVMNMIAGK